MAKEVIRRQGSSSDHTSFTGADGEWTHDTTINAIRVHDGSQAGGFPIFHEGYVESAPDGGTDAYSADFRRPVADGDTVKADFGSANTTTTPTLENTQGTPSGAITITTKDGSALWAGALSGVHELQYASSGPAWRVVDPNPSIQADPVARLDTFTRGHIDGLELANGTDADHDIDIATGVCSMRDGSGNRKLFELASSLTKQIDADWAEGTDAGGFPSGLTLSADTTYHVFLIGKDDGSVDAGFDTDSSASNLLSDASNYSWFRRVGSLYTDGSSNLAQFSQYCDEFLLDTIVEDFDVNDPGTSASLRTMSLPDGIQVRGIFSFELILAGSASVPVGLLITSPDQADTAASANDICDISVSDEGTDQSRNNSNKNVRTNTSSQIRTRVDSSGASVFIRGRTFGWIDDRGRNA